MHFQKRIPILLDLGLDESKIINLRSYLDFIWSANEDLNLVSRQMSFEDLIDNHLIDCLLPLKNFPKDQVKVVADFGSGSGLPAIIYAIQFPQIQFVLYEKSPKKREFLEKCKSFAPNIRVEAVIPLHFKNIDLIMARAFKPCDVIFDLSRSFLSGGGRYFLFKGRIEKLHDEIRDAQNKFKNWQYKIISLKSPVIEVERHLLLINFESTKDKVEN